MTTAAAPGRPVRALVADDEEAPRQQLVAGLAAAWPRLRVVATAANGTDAWDLYLEHEPDVCFLDIRMPGLSGLDVARRIDGAARIVFVTAFGDHALAAFDAGAVDYVTKPVDAERLQLAVARVQASLGTGAPSPDLAALLARLDEPARAAPPLDVVQLGVGREVRLVPIEEVLYFESDARYTRVVHRGGEGLIRMPLKELLARLDPARFWQVHRSIVVAARAVASATRHDDGAMSLALRERPERLAVSRHFQGLFRGQ